ncbi:hydantoinase/oxoprolinase family protein [Streptomyces malaysiensis]|uniref:Hydantoinase/oxoprolinase family protein n=1 Tax=Streptomyces malaysiensis subsp. samsunensis TaxID=459658 RepID=A0A9X2RUJ6_STRMQ|nr:hydantoinase/oxoprolinase family protein [Streptomyces samsunensis]MCQ8831282.1 hydantoinase/oxoprolinase family protein [Streptomyces samsunensis]
MSGESGHRSGRLGIGVDIGGTFTDMVVMDDSGIIHVGKLLTTPDEPARAVEDLIRQTLGRAGIDPGDVSSFVHGTTLVTNALIERRGSRTALLGTAGFSDILEMAREHRYDLYDLMLEMPDPLVPRWLRFDVPERILADGSVLRELDSAYVEQLVTELVDHGVEAIAIAFLHSYKNPQHEEQARRIIERIAPHVRVSISSEVVPEIREYERTSTTVVNAYVQRLVKQYLDDLKERSAALGLPRPPHIMLSNGGVATLDTAGEFPVRMLESGPAGGALAAAAFGKATGTPDLMAFDMGGTTAKLCMIENGAPVVAHDFEVDRVYRMKPGSGIPVRIPVIDMIEIGVGGGSIARIDALGLLTVGPDSAGSVPGPVSYRRGGTEPTVTDADLLLGYLDATYFLGGEMELDLEGARSAIKKRIADPLGVSVEEAAYGIHDSVNSSMANAARVHAIEQGKDPVGQPLFTSGGAGPVHGAGVARALGATTVICPAGAGVISAAGFHTAPLAFDFVRSTHAALDSIDGQTMRREFAAMEADGEKILRDSGLRTAEISHRHSAEVRYVGQGFEILVPISPESDDWRAELKESYRRQYELLYKRQGPDVPLEVLNWRVVSSGPAPAQSLRRPRNAGDKPGNARKGTRSAYFPALGGYHPTPVYDRYALQPGTRVHGPAIVEERESTLVVPPDSECVVEDDGTLVLHLLSPAHSTPQDGSLR